MPGVSATREVASLREILDPPHGFKTKVYSSLTVFSNQTWDSNCKPLACQARTIPLNNDENFLFSVQNTKEYGTPLLFTFRLFSVKFPYISTHTFSFSTQRVTFSVTDDLFC